MRFTFPQTLRLRTEEQIKHVLKRGRRITSAEFALLFCINEVLHPRLCVIVSKKNLRQAPRRNAFKRVMREFFRTHQHELGAIDVIILANKKSELLTKKELCQCIERQWQKLIACLNQRSS